VRRSAIRSEGANESSLGDDGTEAGSFNDDPRVRLAADLGDLATNVLSFAIAVRPDHQMSRLLGLSDEVGLNALLVRILRSEAVSAEGRQAGANRLEGRVERTGLT
jgi:hypothetical protein